MSFQVILIVHVLLALGLIALILMQHGKGADAGAAFGSGAAGSVFGARGANSFLYKLTASLALGFFITSLSLAYLATNDNTDESQNQSVVKQAVQSPSVSDVPELAPVSIPADNSDTSDIPSK